MSECEADTIDSTPPDSETTTPETSFLHTVSGPEAFRTNFLQTLSYKGVWVPRVQRPRSHERVIIFDWDDTLFCTTYIREGGNDVSQQVLETLAASALAALEAARPMGKVFIITNGEEGWVEHCVHTYFPSLLQVIGGIPVISARTRYEQQYPVNQWKVQAFLALQSSLRLEPITSFVSIGDSIYERDAARTTGQVFPNAVIKTVKFVENPSPRELSKQLELLAEKLPQIVESGKKLDISLAKK
jgi:hypothetical protein